MHPGKSIIVIVENDLPTLELYCRELRTDYQVLGTLEEREALRMASQDNVSAIILEPEWDGGRGWQLLRLIQQALASKTVPIVLCSSLDERRRGLEMGAAAYLVKPVLPTELRDTLQRLLHGPTKTRTHKMPPSSLEKL